MEYIHDILPKNGHCGSVFSCVAHKCIWLSNKCIYIKVHLKLSLSLSHPLSVITVSLPRSSYLSIIIIPSLSCHPSSVSSPGAMSAQQQHWRTHMTRQYETRSDSDWRTPSTARLRSLHTQASHLSRRACTRTHVRTIAWWRTTQPCSTPHIPIPLFTNHRSPHLLHVPATQTACCEGVRLHIWAFLLRSTDSSRPFYSKALIQAGGEGGGGGWRAGDKERKTKREGTREGRDGERDALETHDEKVSENHRAWINEGETIDACRASAPGIFVHCPSPKYPRSFNSKAALLNKTQAHIRRI